MFEVNLGFGGAGVLVHFSFRLQRVCLGIAHPEHPRTAAPLDSWSILNSDQFLPTALIVSIIQVLPLSKWGDRLHEEEACLLCHLLPLQPLWQHLAHRRSRVKPYGQFWGFVLCVFGLEQDKLAYYSEWLGVVYWHGSSWSIGSSCYYFPFRDQAEKGCSVRLCCVPAVPGIRVCVLMNS